MNILKLIRQGLKNSARPAVVAGSALLALAAPVHALASCPSGLNGWYGLAVNGTSVIGNTKYLTGALLLNKCVVTGDATVSENNTTTTQVSVSGALSTNTDGTITLTLTPAGGTAETYNLGYTALFNEALGIETDSSAIATIDLKPQIYPFSFGWHYSYSNRDVKGSWVGSCAGPSGQNSDLNYFSMDGAGNLAGVDRSNGYGSFVDNTYSGTYAVSANGEINGSLTVAGNTISLSGVIDNDDAELQYIYYDSSRGFDFCSAKRT